MVDEGQSPPSEESLESPRRKETWHARIVRLCNGEGVPTVALGYALKLIVEGGIIAGTLTLVILLPGFVLVWIGVDLVTDSRVVIAWGTVSTTVFTTSFCLLETQGTPSELFPTPDGGD